MAITNDSEYDTDCQYLEVHNFVIEGDLTPTSTPHLIGGTYQVLTLEPEPRDECERVICGFLRAPSNISIGKMYPAECYFLAACKL